MVGELTDRVLGVIMRLTKLYFAALMPSLIIGYAIVDLEKYVYKKGIEDPEVRVEEKQRSERSYKKRGICVFSRFYSLTRSYSLPTSHIPNFYLLTHADINLYQES